MLKMAKFMWILLFGLEAWAGKHQHTPIQIEEIAFTKYQQKAIRSSGGVLNYKFIDSKTVMLLGEEALWRFEVDTGRLSKISLEHNLLSSDEFKVLASDDYSTSIAGSKKLVQIVNSKPPRIWAYAHPLESPGMAKKVFAWSDKTIWITSSSIAVLDRYGKRATLKYRSKKFEELNFFELDKESGTLWVTDSRSVYRLNLSGRGQKTEKTYETNHKIRGISLKESRLYVWTANVFLEMSKSGELIKRVPVDGKRLLVDAHLGRQGKLFIFKDKLAQYFLDGENKSLHFKLPVGRVKSLKSLRSEGPLVSFIADTQFKLFLIRELIDGQKKIAIR